MSTARCLRLMAAILGMALAAMSAGPSRAAVPQLVEGPAAPATPAAGEAGQGNDLWTWIGPRYDVTAGQAPDVIQLLYEPTNPNIVYAGTNQGVYRSVDGGETWQPRNEGLGGYGDLVISGLARHPSDPNTLFIGTWGYGVFKSTNAGQAWTRLADPLAGARGQAGLVPEAEPEIRVRAGGPSYQHDTYAEAAPPQKSLLPGMDQQPPPERLRPESPQAPPLSLSWTAVRRVTVNPGNANELYAQISGWGLYRSSNGGASWEPVTLGSGSGRTFVFAPSNSQVRYASFGDGGTSGSFYRTTNGGANWVLMTGEVLSQTVLSVAIHPTNPNIVLAGTRDGGLYRSDTGGNTWTLVSEDLPDTRFFSLAFSPSNPSVVYAGGNMWPYRSDNAGVDWHIADLNFAPWYLEALAVHPTLPDTVLVGAQNAPYSGVYKANLASATPAFGLRASGMLDTFVLDLERDPANPNKLFAATWGAGVFQSANGGSTWTRRLDLPPYVYDIEAVIGPTSTVLYAGTFYVDWGVYKSANGGSTWAEISWGYDSDVSFSLEAVNDNPNTLVAATYKGVQYSNDGGLTWQDAAGLDDGVVLRLCEFGASGRLLAATYGGGVYTSQGGQAWSALNTGLPAASGGSIYAYDVACSQGSPQRGFAAGLGVFQLPAGSSTWQPIGTALPPGYIRTIDFVDSVGDLIAGSHASGVYVRPANTVIWKPLNRGLSNPRVRSLLVMSEAPERFMAGTNGSGAFEYLLFTRPAPWVLVPMVRK